MRESSGKQEAKLKIYMKSHCSGSEEEEEEGGGCEESNCSYSSITP